MLDRLFVYGTLRRGGGAPVRRRLRRDWVCLGEAWMVGLLYEVADYPGAVPCDGAGPQIRGELYRLVRPERVLALLDRYEGCGPGHASPHEYRRAQVKVHTAGGTLMAWVYLYNRTPRGLRRIRSGDYLKARRQRRRSTT